MPAIGFEIKRKCKVCGEVFIAKTLDSLYCSPKCSKVAWKRKKDAQKKEEKLTQLALHIPDIREYLSVREAVAMFGVERTTLYRLIKNGTVPAINVGKRLTRIKRSALEAMFLTRTESNAEKTRPVPKRYSMEPGDCYTIGEICNRYHVDDSTVWSHIRKYSIPSRQIGNFVYVPKEEIDNLYKSEVK